MKDFNLIYSENHKLVLNFIKYKIGDQSLAEELTNDVFMRIYKHLNAYDELKSSMKTWVMNITKNIIIDHYRKVKMDTISIDKSIGDTDDSFNFTNFLPNTDNQYRDMVSDETINQIRNEISSLKSYRNVAELFFNEELSYDEICVRTNLPIGTVKGQIHRVRKKLMKRLITMKP